MDADCDQTLINNSTVTEQLWPLIGLEFRNADVRWLSLGAFNRKFMIERSHKEYAHISMTNRLIASVH